MRRVCMKIVRHHISNFFSSLLTTPCMYSSAGISQARPKYVAAASRTKGEGLNTQRSSRGQNMIPQQIITNISEIFSILLGVKKVAIFSKCVPLSCPHYCVQYQHYWGPAQPPNIGSNIFWNSSILSRNYYSATGFATR